MPCLEQHLGVRFQHFPLRTMISHGIPVTTMRTGHNGATKNPRNNSQVRFHTGTPAHQNKEIRRVREQTSPQVARVIGRTQRWDEGGGLSGGSSSIRRFHIWPDPMRDGTER